MSRVAERLCLRDPASRMKTALFVREPGDAVTVVVHSVDHYRQYTRENDGSGPPDGPLCTFLILVDSDWSLSLKKVDSGLTLLLV